LLLGSLDATKNIDKLSHKCINAICILVIDQVGLAKSGHPGCFLVGFCNSGLVFEISFKNLF